MPNPNGQPFDLPLALVSTPLLQSLKALLGLALFLNSSLPFSGFDR